MNNTFFVNPDEIKEYVKVHDRIPIYGTINPEIRTGPLTICMLAGEEYFTVFDEEQLLFDGNIKSWITHTRSGQTGDLG